MAASATRTNVEKLRGIHEKLVKEVSEAPPRGGAGRGPLFHMGVGGLNHPRGAGRAGRIARFVSVAVSRARTRLFRLRSRPPRGRLSL